MAAQVEGDADRIAEEIGGRWDAYAAAVFLAKGVKDGVKRHLPYFGATALRFLKIGITAEAKSARDVFLGARRRKAKSDRSFAEYLERVEAEKNAPRLEAMSMVDMLTAKGVGMRLDGVSTIRFVDAQGEDFTATTPRQVSPHDLEELKRLKPQILELLKERDGQAVDAEMSHA